ncbi:MAG: bifunctional UDP-N-acetylglucosamine diphosphorylase/glucosamine-1-phosphate N-acetyltransferase GlmU [Gammaproteobacteria bacterium]|nr:bifunctional UDP-N-acetylglucosamine diphosphorylase/glucosamine-1-phosphate N-acetyltransferase GlmU [Pseudomonadota bacterium]MCH9662547.1 bifunctional UDP-N-acetylglucosamine diphosphorylase/glucosamine-1-phosphate N-acetyltransferase GlmU [Gammaproteobacteria bacterium]
MIGQAHLNTAVVVLAAGKGSRMNSDTPKVMHMLGDRSLLYRVLETAFSLNPGQIVLVLGSDQDDIRQDVTENFAYDITFATQEQQRGTGDAVRCSLGHLQGDIENVLVMYGDVPLIESDGLARMLRMSASPGIFDDEYSHSPEALVLMVAECDSMYSTYGRVIHDEDGRVQEIVEFRDCSPWQQEIMRVSSGVMVLPRRPLDVWIAQLKPFNEQGEYYLTDVVAMARAQQMPVLEVQVSEDDIQGVNTMIDLAQLERIYARRWAEVLLEQGVRISDPDRFDCRGTLTAGRGVCIDVNCVFEGTVELADNVIIGANCLLRDCVIGAGTTVLPFTYMEGARVGERARIGPFARIRPATDIHDEARVGNFVEVKNSVIGRGAKASHLSYIGDSDIGTEANIGAGTVTCNYDGVNKNRTTIGSDVFVGSGSMLVAPVNVGNGAIIGAGTVVRSDISAEALEVSEHKQTSKENFAPEYWRKKKSAAANKAKSNKATTVNGNGNATATQNPDEGKKPVATKAKPIRKGSTSTKKVRATADSDSAK